MTTLEYFQSVARARAMGAGCRQAKRRYPRERYGSRALHAANWLVKYG